VRREIKKIFVKEKKSKRNYVSLSGIPRSDVKRRRRKTRVWENRESKSREKEEQMSDIE